MCHAVSTVAKDVPVTQSITDGLAKTWCERCGGATDFRVRTAFAADPVASLGTPSSERLLPKPDVRGRSDGRKSRSMSRLRGPPVNRKSALHLHEQMRERRADLQNLL